MKTNIGFRRYLVNALVKSHICYAKVDMQTCNFEFQVRQSSLLCKSRVYNKLVICQRDLHNKLDSIKYRVRCANLEFPRLPNFKLEILHNKLDIYPKHQTPY